MAMELQIPLVSSRLLDVDAVASMLDVSSRHVYRMADAGRMPAPVRLGGSVRWDRNALQKWLDDGCPPIVNRGQK